MSDSITNLFASSTLEGISFCLDFLGSERLEEILISDLLVGCLTLFRGHILVTCVIRLGIASFDGLRYLARHLAEPLNRQLSWNNTFSQTWVVFVFKVYKERSNLRLVCGGSAIVVRINDRFDSFSFTQDLVNGYDMIAYVSEIVTSWEDRKIRTWTRVRS